MKSPQSSVYETRTQAQALAQLRSGWLLKVATASKLSDSDHHLPSVS